jgi:hypothetical protein
MLSPAHLSQPPQRPQRVAKVNHIGSIQQQTLLLLLLLLL